MKVNVTRYCATCRAYRPATERTCARCGGRLKQKWALDYRLAGRRIHEPIPEAQTLTEARAAATRKAAELDGGLAVGGRIDRLEELCSWYFQQPRVAAKTSIDRDRYSWAHLLRVMGRRTRIRDLAPQRWAAYVRTRLAERDRRVLPGKDKQPRPTSPATVNRELEVLRAALNLAVAERVLTRNPLAGVRKLEERNVRDRVLTPDEEARLLDHAEPHVADIVRLALATGMRKEEVLGLTWDEVDLAGEVPAIRLGQGRTKEAAGKTIPLRIRDLTTGQVDDTAEQVLRRQVRVLHEPRVFLLPRRDGARAPLTSIDSGFKGAVRRAGITDFRFHDLRHTFINRMEAMGYPRAVVMQITGHKTESAHKRYRHVAENEVLAVGRGEVKSAESAHLESAKGA